MNVLDEIKDYINVTGLSANYICQKIGISDSMYSAWSKGKNKPSEESVEKIEKFLENPIVAKQPIGKTIRELRADFGMSRYEFARFVEINADMIAKWELGKTVPVDKSMEKLEPFLDPNYRMEKIQGTTIFCGLYLPE